MALHIKLLILIVAVCCPAGVGHVAVARSCGREYAGAGGGLHGRGGELRGPGIDDDVAAEQHAAASLRSMRACFLRSCRSLQLSLLRATTYLARPRYGTNSVRRIDNLYALREGSAGSRHAKYSAGRMALFADTKRSRSNCRCYASAAAESWKVMHSCA